MAAWSSASRHRPCRRCASTRELRSRIRKVDRKLGDVHGGEPGFRRYWPANFLELDEKRRALRVAIKAKAASKHRPTSPEPRDAP